MRILVILLLINIVLAIGCSSRKNSASDMANPLQGSWLLKGDKDTTAQLIFGNGNRYQIRFATRDESWGGVYRFSGDVVHVWDLFCGSKAPGSYHFSRSGDSLTLRIANDPYCTRAEFFPRTWQRMSNVTDSQITALLSQNPKVPAFDSILNGKKIASLQESDTFLLNAKRQQAAKKAQ